MTDELMIPDRDLRDIHYRYLTGERDVFKPKSNRKIKVDIIFIMFIIVPIVIAIVVVPAMVLRDIHEITNTQEKIIDHNIDSIIKEDKARDEQRNEIIKKINTQTKMLDEKIKIIISTNKKGKTGPLQ